MVTRFFLSQLFTLNTALISIYWVALLISLYFSNCVLLYIDLMNRGHFQFTQFFQQSLPRKRESFTHIDFNRFILTRDYLALEMSAFESLQVLSHYNKKQSLPFANNLKILQLPINLDRTWGTKSFHGTKNVNERDYN